MKLKQFLTSIFLLLGILSLFSQSDYRAGYIINKEKDTIYGFLDYRGNIKNANECAYKKTLEDPKQIFYPNEIEGYRYTDSKFFISKSIVHNGIKKQFFLEYLINGILDMYFLRDEIEDRYFVENEEGELRELKNEDKEYIQNGIRYTKKSQEYIRTLKLTFKDSPKISKKVESIGLNHKSLIKITQEYHNELCTTGEECIIYEKKEVKATKSYGVVAGVSYMFPLKVDSSSYSSYLEGGDIENNILPSFGMFFKINSPNFNERVFLYCEANYKFMNQEFSKTQFTNDKTYLNNYSYNLGLASVAAAIRYEFPKGKIRPVFEGGASYSFSLKSEYSHDAYELNNDGTKDFIVNKANSEDLYFRTINIGAGFNCNYFKNKTMTLILGYQIGEIGRHNLFNINSSVSNLSITTSFQLNN